MSMTEKMFNDLYDTVYINDAEIIRLKRKLWLFEWFLFFLMIYMCYIAYNLYNISWDVIELSHQATTFPQPIFIP